MGFKKYTEVEKQEVVEAPKEQQVKDEPTQDGPKNPVPAEKQPY